MLMLTRNLLEVDATVILGTHQSSSWLWREATRAVSAPRHAKRGSGKVWSALNNFSSPVILVRTKGEPSPIRQNGGDGFGRLHGLVSLSVTPMHRHRAQLWEWLTRNCLIDGLGLKAGPPQCITSASSCLLVMARPSVAYKYTEGLHGSVPGSQGDCKRRLVRSSLSLSTRPRVMA